MSDLWRRLRAYAASDDPLVSLANVVALTVASSQPFYPLYLYWIVGPDIAPSLFTWLSTPFFLAVPALARVNPIAGRALLPLAGIANTMLTAKLFGVASGVEIFLIPCALLGMVLFRPRERIAGYAIAALALGAYTLMAGRYGAPAHLYTADEYARFLRLNAVSAGTLTALIGLMVANLLAEHRE